MKAESTIRKEMNRLFRMAKDENLDDVKRRAAYEAATALQWVIKKVYWTPHGVVLL